MAIAVKAINVSFIGGDLKVNVDAAGTVSLTPANLTGVDPDNSATELTYTVSSAPTHGQLELTTAPGIAITRFTQDDVDKFRVHYVHDGSETTADSLQLLSAMGQRRRRVGPFVSPSMLRHHRRRSLPAGAEEYETTVT